MENRIVNNIDTVLVFKTNLDDNMYADIIIDDMKKINPKAISNFDLDDCDKIFRVENSSLDAQTIIKYFNKIGFYCEELH